MATQPRWTTSTGYSAKERKLMAHYGVEHMCALNGNPFQVYAAAVTVAFLNNHQSIEDASLRACVAQLNNAYDGGVFRGTQEWDDLIKFTDPTHE